MKRISGLFVVCVMLSMAAIGVEQARDKPLEGPEAGIRFRKGAEINTFEKGAVLFSDRNTKVENCPVWLSGKRFLKSHILRSDLAIVRDGVLTVLTRPVEKKYPPRQARFLEQAGFVRICAPESFQLFGTNESGRVAIYQKQMRVGDRLSMSLSFDSTWGIALGVDAESLKGVGLPQAKTETLYNGIVLPHDPRDRTDMTAYDSKPLPVPYLDQPPAVIPIALGRQLFVDDFLIERTTLRRKWHKAVKHAANPVLKPETLLERGVNNHYPPMAAPFSDGVWYDGADGLFKAWYFAGWRNAVAYAFSHDGITWIRPELKAEPGTNRVIPQRRRDSSAVIMDPDAGPDGMRFKMLVFAQELFVSRDGLTWSDPVPTDLLIGDRSTIFYNPFRKVWVQSIRAGWHSRSREYSESANFLDGAKFENRVAWLRTDEMDLQDDHWFYAFPDRLPGRKSDKPQLYNFDAVAYESLMLGTFMIHLGPANKACEAEGLPKMAELHLGFSRDGFHWSRPDDRTPFIPAGRKSGTWDRCYLNSNAALCLVMGDELWFYYTGFAGGPWPDHPKGYMYANASMGIATLRRDGFASMDAGPEGGELVTRPVTIGGKACLFVNADAKSGELRVEMLDAQGQVINGFTADQCAPMTSDSTRFRIVWEGDKTLNTLDSAPVRFRFRLKNGKLYAFWVADTDGASGGYLAGGGPGYKSLRDE